MIMLKKWFLIGIVGLLFFMPVIPSARGAEKNEYLDPFTFYGFHVSLKEGFSLNWEFETYNDAFQANVRIDDSEGHFTNLGNGVAGSGVYLVPKDDSYFITLYNIDPGVISGYIRFSYNDPPRAISSFFPLIEMQ